MSKGAFPFRSSHVQRHSPDRSNRYGLITEQRKGSYKYFIDLGDRMEVVEPRTAYVDEVRPQVILRGPWRIHTDARSKDMQHEADKARILYGMDLGATAESAAAAEGEIEDGVGVRTVPPTNRVSYSRSRPHPLNDQGPSLLSRYSIPRMSYAHSARSVWILVSFLNTCVMRKQGRLANPVVIKLLGFKPRSDLQFEDNIKHSLFIYPDEMVGSQ